MSEFFIRQIGQKNLPDLSIYGNSFVYITLLRISGTAPRNTKMFRTNLLFRGVIALRAAPCKKTRRPPPLASGQDGRDARKCTGIRLPEVFPHQDFFRKYAPFRSETSTIYEDLCARKKAVISRRYR